MRVLDPLLRRIIALADDSLDSDDESDEGVGRDGSEHGDSNRDGYDYSGEDPGSSDEGPDDVSSSDGSDEEIDRDAGELSHSDDDGYEGSSDYDSDHDSDPDSDSDSDGSHEQTDGKSSDVNDDGSDDGFDYSHKYDSDDDGSNEESGRNDCETSDTNHNGYLYRAAHNSGELSDTNDGSSSGDFHDNNDDDLSDFNNAMDIDSPSAEDLDVQSEMGSLESPQIGEYELESGGEMTSLTGFYQAQSYERYLEVLMLQLEALYPLLNKTECPDYGDPHYTTIQRPVSDPELPHYLADTRPPVYEDIVLLDERPTQHSTLIAGHGRQENPDPPPRTLHNVWMSRVDDERHSFHPSAENLYYQLFDIANDLFQVLGMFRGTKLEREACLALSKILKCISAEVGAHSTFREQEIEFELALRNRDPDVSQELERLGDGCAALAHATDIVEKQVTLMVRYCGLCPAKG